MAKTFLDTNILVYFVTRTDPAKSEQSARLLTQKPAISVQVLNEFVNVARNKLRTDWSDFRSNLVLFERACSVIDLTYRVQRRACAIAERYDLNIYDANIVAAAEAGEVDILYSEDLQHCQKIGSLEIVNPYV